MKILKRFAILIISITLSQTAFACGGGWYEASYDNIYRIDFMLQEGALGETYHNHEVEFTGNSIDDNLEEWVDFFDGKFSKELISSLIYTEDEFVNHSNIHRALNGLDSKKKEWFKEYMVIAKQAETISNADDLWAYYRDDEPQINQGLINKLTKDITAKIKVIDNSFMKERYTFQLTKLYYYGERYDKAIEAYDTFYKKNNTNSIMRYWGLDYKAGAQMQSGDTINANYNFLQVFDQYPGRRSKSYYSMVFSNEDQFSKTLNICKTDHDKATFYFVRGSNKHSVVLEDLKSCFQYAPKSEYAKVLMANELVKMEHIFWKKDLGYDDWGNDVEDMPMEQLQNYVADFIVFAESAVSQSNDKTFWNISLAYLYSLHADYQKSSNLLASVSTSNDLYKKQIQSIDLLNYIYLNPKFNNKNEEMFGQMWFDYNDGAAESGKSNWGGYGDINNYISDYFEGYYKDIDPLKSFLFSGQTFSDFRYEYEEKLEVDAVHDLRISLSEVDKTKLQHYAEGCFLAGTNHSNIGEGLLEVEATLLMRDPKKLKEAVAYFDKLPSTYAIPTNPFNMTIKDCIWGGWSDETSCNHKTGNYTKGSLAKKLLEMKNLAEKNNSAMDYYLLGNAYYNMTYFGHAYDALSYYRSGSSYTGFDDCSAALGFYEKAITLFEDNREMQAKSLFMAAKCTQNLYFIDLNETSKYGYWGIDFDYQNPKQSIIDYNAEIEAAGYRDHFAILKESFGDTKFYQQAINECSYFDLYVHY